MNMIETDFEDGRYSHLRARIVDLMRETKTSLKYFMGGERSFDTRIYARPESFSDAEDIPLDRLERIRKKLEGLVGKKAFPQHSWRIIEV